MPLLNWLDLETKLAAMLWDVEAYRDFLQNEMSYDLATSFCTDCPRRWEDDYPRARQCCKDSDNYFSEEELEHIRRIRALAVQIRAMVSSESLQKTFEARKENK